MRILAEILINLTQWFFNKNHLKAIFGCLQVEYFPILQKSLSISVAKKIAQLPKFVTRLRQDFLWRMQPSLGEYSNFLEVCFFIFAKEFCKARCFCKKKLVSDHLEAATLAKISLRRIFYLLILRWTNVDQTREDRTIKISNSQEVNKTPMRKFLVHAL